MKQIVALIKSIVQTDQIMTITSGKVSEISGDSCTVTRQGLPDLLGVRLGAVRRTLENHVTITPKIGSDVQCAVIENIPEETFLVGYSEVEKVTTSFGNNKVEVSIDGLISQQGNSVFKVTEEGITIERGGKNLLNELSNYIDEVSKVIVVTGTSVNVPALQQVKTNIQNILK